MWPFTRKPAAPIDPEERMRAAIDEVNAAFHALPQPTKSRRIRLFIKGWTSGRYGKMSPPENPLVIGYWDSDEGCFIATYETEER